MKLYQILNMVLLALSSATILLSLVSYVLYRARQLPIAAKGDESNRDVGKFFRRYRGATATGVPQATLLGVKAVERTFGWIPQHLGKFFVVTAAAIFLILASDRYFRELGVDRDRSATAHNYKDKVSHGLLRTYDLTDSQSADPFVESVPTALRQRANELAALLGAKNVYVVRSKKGKSQNGWEKFLTDNSVRFRTTSTVNGLDDAGLIFLVDIEGLTATETQVVEKYLNRGKGVLAAGVYLPPRVNPAESNAKANPNTGETKDWAARVFGVRFVRSESEENYQPTLFAAGATPWWEVPPGLLLRWYPKANGYHAISVSGSSPAMESDYKGLPVGPPGEAAYTRAQFGTFGKGRTAWLGLDPSEESKLSDAEKQYSRAIALSSLAWAAGVAQTRVSTWKGGAPAAMALFVDSEDRFETTVPLSQMFAELKIPTTYFLVSNLFQKSPAFLSQLTDRDELASHSENHDTFAEQILVKQFERIQSSRLEIEELSNRRVTGFRPPVEKFDAATIEAATQNRLSYFVGDNRFPRFAPTWISGGKLLFYSRMTADDFALIKRRDLASLGELGSQILFDYHRVEAQNGVFLLGLHTQIFGLDTYHDALKQALTTLVAKPIWKTTFRELTRWWKDRAMLHCEISAPKRTASAGVMTYAIEFKNAGGDGIDDVECVLDPGGNSSFHYSADASPAANGLSIQIDPITGLTRLRVARLDPEQTLVTTIQAEKITE